MGITDTERKNRTTVAASIERDPNESLMRMENINLINLD